MPKPAVIDQGSPRHLRQSANASPAPRPLARTTSFTSATLSNVRRAATRRARARARGEEESAVIVPAKTKPCADVVSTNASYELLRGKGLAAAAQPIVHAGNRAYSPRAARRCTTPALPASPMHVFSWQPARPRGERRSPSSYGVAAWHTAQRASCSSTRTPRKLSPKNLCGDQRLRAAKARRNWASEINEDASRGQRNARSGGQPGRDRRDLCLEDSAPASAAMTRRRPAHFSSSTWGGSRIHEARTAARVVRDLVRRCSTWFGARQKGVTGAEAASARMGFQLVQGYMTGRPVMVAKL